MIEKKMKYWFIVVGLIFIVFSTFILQKRWKAWFGNYTESVYQTENKVDRITLTPGASFLTQRTLTWRCGEKKQKMYVKCIRINKEGQRVDSLTYLAEDTLIRSRSGKAVYYSVKLNNLQTNSTYAYTIYSSRIKTPEYVFSMPAIHKHLRFIYLGDLQDKEGAETPIWLQELKNRDLKPAFIALAGDVIEGPTDVFWKHFYKAYAPFSTSTPLLVSTGNHEYYKKGLFRLLDSRWKYQFNFPLNGPRNFLGRSYYVDFPLMRFIVMDTNGISGLEAIFMHKQWLMEVLKSSTQPWQIVMFHHSVKPVRESRKHPVMNFIFKPILEEYGADLVLQGHDHAYSRINTKTTPVYIISSSSPKMYMNGFDSLHTRLGSGMALYQTIDVTGEKIHYRSYTYQHKLYDNFEIIHSYPKNKIRDLSLSIPEYFGYNNFSTDEKGIKKKALYLQQIKKRVQQKVKNNNIK